MKTISSMEQAILEIRNHHPSWGGRKIKRRLETRGFKEVPSPSTITAILRRHDRLDPVESRKHKPWQRFEADKPNELWQIDFKGHFPLSLGGRCHPLTVLDDHSRFALGLRSCADERGKTVREELTGIFRRYGLPDCFLMDNGAPWGSPYGHAYTPLTIWFIRIGIGVSHARPHHPQTLGKDERFHRTLKAELLQGRNFRDLRHAQQKFDRWRDMYNLERPHDALDLDVPAQRYQPSARSFPEVLPVIEYGPGDSVRKVQCKGEVHFRGRIFKVPNGFQGQRVALRSTLEDGVFDVFYCQERVAEIDLREQNVRD
jgi:transposase InsO family protein